MKKLNPQQRELLIEWVQSMAAKSLPITIEDVSQHFQVHYQTARDWVSQLEQMSILKRHPFRAGRKVQYVLSANGEGSLTETEDPFIQVVRGAETLSLADWVSGTRPVKDPVPLLRDGKLASIGAAMAYLYVRSYYADAPDHQHLRGITTPVEVRAFVGARLAQLRLDLEVVEQMLSYSGPWREGGEFARRFGLVADLAGVMQVAQQGERIIQEWRERNSLAE